MKITKYILLSTTVLGLVNPLVALADDSNLSSTSSTSSSSKVENSSSSEQKDLKQNNNNDDQKSEVTNNQGKAEVEKVDKNTQSAPTGTFNGITYTGDEATGEATVTNGNNITVTDNKVEIASSVTLNGRKYNVTDINRLDMSSAGAAELVLPDGLKRITRIDNLSGNMTVPKSVTEISHVQLSGKNQVITILNPDTKFGSYNGNSASFYSNDYSTGVKFNLPEGMTTMPYLGRIQIDSLDQISMPSTMTEIGDSAFNSYSLKEVTLPDSITRIGKYAFADNHITKINFPNSLTEIDDGAFVNRTVQYGSSNTFLSLDLPGSIKRIGKAAFGNTRVGSLTLHEGLKEIGERAFGEYQVQAGNPDNSVNGNVQTTQGLKNVTIPASVETIGDDAFANNGISRIKFKGDNTKTGENIASEQITGAHIYAHLNNDKERSYQINNLFDLYKQHVTKTNDDKSDILKWAGDNNDPTFDWKTDDGKVSGKWVGQVSSDNSLMILKPEVIKEGQKYSQDDLFVKAKGPLGNDQKFDRNVVKIVKDDVNVNKPGTYNVTFRLDANVNYDNTDVVQLEPLEETTTVTVLPAEKGGVVVSYVDENGKDIAPSETLTGKIGDTYKTEKKDIKGYVLSGVSGKEEGKYTDKPQAVTYIYKKIEGNTPSKPVANGNVTVRYVDESNKEIAKSDIIKGKAGETYKTEKKNIDGYTFKEVQGNATGNITAFGQTVTYIYTKNPEKGADVTVKYVDENGKAIAKSEVKSGNVGDKYTTEKKDITGYTFKEVKGSANGEFTDKAQTVTYIYTKNPEKGADVTVKYVDENGKEIAKSEVKSGNVGDKYTTEKKDITGYTFKEVKGSANGEFTDKAQTVTYVYTKNDDNVKPSDPSQPAKPDTPDYSGDTDNNSNTSEQPGNSSMVNDVVNNVVQSVLPKTAAEKVTLAGIVSVVLASLIGLVVWKRRK